MIRPFKTTTIISHFNVMLGLLTQSESRHRSKPGFSGLEFIEDERHYILAICDWCGAREIIDDPFKGVVEDSSSHGIRTAALTDGLGWICSGTGRETLYREFCTRKCQDDNERRKVY